jgi:hypothetical protein
MKTVRLSRQLRQAQFTQHRVAAARPVKETDSVAAADIYELANLAQISRSNTQGCKEA